MSAETSGDEGRPEPHATGLSMKEGQRYMQLSGVVGVEVCCSAGLCCLVSLLTVCVLFLCRCW